MTRVLNIGQPRNAFAAGVKLLSSITCTRQAIGDADPIRHLARSLHTRETALIRYLDGSARIPKDGRVARRLIESLVWVAGMICDRDPKKASELRSAAKAIDPVLYRLEYRDHERHIAQMDARGQRPNYLKPGLHVARFLSESGEIVLLAIDEHGRLGYMGEFESLSRGRAPSDVIGVAASSMVDFFQSYGHRLYPEGVHLAPWRPWTSAKTGVTYVAIDDQHRLIATVDVPNLEDGDALVAAQKDMAAALEVVKEIRTVSPDETPNAYDDGYDDGHETDRDDHCGESWKDGTIYDKRKKRDE